MPTDTEQLVVSLEARIKDFERNFQRANRTASSNFKAIEGQAKRSADALEAHMSKSARGVNLAMSALKGGAAGLIAGLSVGALTGIASRLGDITKNMANIGNEAKRAGLSTKAFQEFKFVAEQNRVSLDALTDGFKELSLRADEFIVTGGGSAAEAFKRLGYGAQDLKRKLKDPSALFTEIIGKLGQLDKAAQIRITDEIFGGTGGEQFLQLVSQGEAGIRAQIAAANDLGAVMSDELIARADELDRKFNQISTTIGTTLKQSVVGLVGAMDDFLDSFNQVEEQSTRNVQDRLSDVYGGLEAEKQKLADLQQISMGTPADVMNIRQSEKEIERLTGEAMKLRDILDRRNGYDESFVYKTGQDAKGATPSLENLYGALNQTGTAATQGATGLNTFAGAVRALKNEIPDLANNLAQLDAQARINSAYTAALGQARTMGEVYQANALRDSALGALASKDTREAADKGMLDLIGHAEGTDKARGYNETLSYGKFAGGPKNLVTMSLDEIDAMQTAMLQHPDNHYNSSATGRYQIVQKTLRGLRSSLGLKGTDVFDAGMQDRLAQELLRQRGNDPVGLRNEWEGLRKVDDATIRRAYDGASVQMPAIDPGKAESLEQVKQQADAYRQIIAEAKLFTAEQQTEQQALSMTTQAAMAYRYEQDMLNQAMRDGIALTPQQRQEIQQLAQGMATAEAATQQYAMTQEQAREVSGFFASTTADALTGLITGTLTAEQALQQLIGSLAKAIIQAALLGQGPLASLLGGKAGGGGLLGGIFGALLGAKDGGFITPRGVQRFASGGSVRGPGTSRSDSIPALLSDGEYVVNADATRKNRAALEAINSGKAQSLDATRMGKGSIRAVSNQVSNIFSPTIPITVQASGNRETDAALSDRLATEMDTMLENKMTEFVQRQQRPGAMLGKRGFV